MMISSTPDASPSTVHPKPASTSRARQHGSSAHAKRTVDVQHVGRMKEFEKHTTKADEVRSKLVDVDARLQSLNQRPRIELSEDELQIMLDLLDSKRDLERERESLSASSAEVEYLMNAGNVLFKYYDVLEKGNPQPLQTSTDVHANSILKYFTVKAENLPPPPPAPKVSAKKSSKITVDTNRASLLDQYLSVTDPAYLKELDDQAQTQCCQFCGSTDRTIRQMDSYIVCNKCHALECILVDHDKPSYKEPPKEISYFAYKRVNHFNEWLSQIQGKETTDIPAEVYDKILLEIQKQKINNLADLNHTKIREILKKLRINKYYEHTPYLLHKLNGKPIPHLSPELEDQLRTMFKMIQYPFLVHAPPTRRNFLSYAYVLHKTTQLLGHEEFLSSFPLLKSRDKLAAQDAIWKAICNDLGWEFVSSL
jgi:hypothetical protein